MSRDGLSKDRGRKTVVHRPSKVEKMVFSWGISHFLAHVIRSNVFYIPQHNRDGKNLLLIYILKGGWQHGYYGRSGLQILQIFSSFNLAIYRGWWQSWSAAPQHGHVIPGQQHRQPLPLYHQIVVAQFTGRGNLLS